MSLRVLNLVLHILDDNFGKEVIIVLHPFTFPTFSTNVEQLPIYCVFLDIKLYIEPIGLLGSGRVSLWRISE